MRLRTTEGRRSVVAVDAANADLTGAGNDGDVLVAVFLMVVPSRVCVVVFFFPASFTDVILVLAITL